MAIRAFLISVTGNGDYARFYFVRSLFVRNYQHGVAENLRNFITTFVESWENIFKAELEACCKTSCSKFYPYVTFTANLEGYRPG